MMLALAIGTLSRCFLNLQVLSLDLKYPVTLIVSMRLLVTAVICVPVTTKLHARCLHHVHCRFLEITLLEETLRAL
ncbi:hypothetical protein BJ878DRAFT_527406 [Calycina marina]|uniref:Uncharacterized protein n=1 Tax=Calycina marina TaxID=1763456 RepID=A0A9P7YW72_9HELO|nr:hypothetical protein BJ878DRAFT_527406 [Calycina marina]